MNTLSPTLIISDFSLVTSQPAITLTLLPIVNVTQRQFRASVLVALKRLWQQRQSRSTGNRKWAKSIHKYVQRFIKQFVFIPARPVIHLADGTNQPILQHIKYLKKITQPLSKKEFADFIKQADSLIAEKFSSSQDKHLLAKQVLAEFVTYQNTHFIHQEYHYTIPAPPVKRHYKDNPTIIPDDYVAQGKKLVKIVRRATVYWQQQPNYTCGEIIGWLIFSGVIFGGINYQPLLSGWFDSLIQGKSFAFDNERLIMSVRYASDSYGNELVDEQLFNTQQIIVDYVSQCWLYRYRQNPHSQPKTQDIEFYLFKVLEPICDEIGYDNITQNWLLCTASYFWTMLDNVNISQALVGVMQGRHKTTGLIHDEFLAFLQAKHHIDTTTADYDLIALSKLQITSTQTDSNSLAENPTTLVEVADKNVAKQTIKAQVRRSDLVGQIQKLFATILDKKYSLPKDPITQAKPDKNQVLLERIDALQSIFSLPSERILIGWVISLIQAKSASHASILHYLGIIGYEWLYFTTAQPIEIWTEEDFTELYDEILDYKSEILGNEDIAYVARRLQTLHNYAVKAKFIDVKVIIEQAKSKRKVRSQLLSPHTYIAILEQLRTHVQGLDSDMLVLFFILAYRTGMRKKELLGLTFADLENLATPETALVIRPNSHRSTKTEGSTRRITFFDLLTQDELAFTINYLRSHQGNKPSRLVFSFSDSQLALPDYFPLQLFKQMLKDIDADENTAFHTLRHCAITNLALALNADSTLATRLTGYNLTEIEKIRQAILGVETNAQDKWYALAFLVGHISPERGFEYYNHVATLMATYNLANANYAKFFNFESFCNITGFTKVRLKENGYKIDKNAFELAQIRPLLLRLSLQKTKPVVSHFNIDQQIHFSQVLHSDSLGKESLMQKYSVSQVLDFLLYLDDGISLEKASIDTNIAIKEAQMLYQNAKIIANLTTRTVKNGNKNKARFTQNSQTLSPLAVQTEKEKVTQRLLLTNLKQLVVNNEASFQKFIKYGLEKLSTEQSALPLSLDELQEFIPIAKALLPDAQWLICYDQTTVPLDTLLKSYDFKPTEKHKPSRITTLSPKKNRPKKNICELGILHRRKVKANEQLQFSSLLRFAVHYGFIITRQNTVA